jgi:hypothetical protein
MLMLIRCERKTLLNDWLILTDKLKQIAHSIRVSSTPSTVLTAKHAGCRRRLAGGEFGETTNKLDRDRAGLTCHGVEYEMRAHVTALAASSSTMGDG